MESKWNLFVDINIMKYTSGQIPETLEYSPPQGQEFKVDFLENEARYEKMLLFLFDL